MFYLSIEDYFSSAHQLRGYQGKCENLHGHNWKVVLTVKGEKLNNIGLLIDFHDLKKFLKEILSDLDHKNINEIEYFRVTNPSSENISEYIYNKMNEKLAGLPENSVQMDSATVFESETSRCTYKK